MKTKLVSLFILLFTISLFAQEAKVPKNVKDSFAKLYPTAKEVKWSKEGDEEFEASFINGTGHISVVLDEMGKVEETETVIKVDELSKTIHEFVAKNYAGYKISEAAKIVDDKGIVTFEAEVTKGKEKKDLIFDSNGKPITKESKESEEDSEDSDMD